MILYMQQTLDLIFAVKGLDGLQALGLGEYKKTKNGILYFIIKENETPSDSTENT